MNTRQKETSGSAGRPKVHLGAYVEPELYERATIFAQAQERSLSFIFRKALLSYLEQNRA